MDPEAINSRITRIEEMIRSGSFSVSSSVQLAPTEEEEERPPMPDDHDAPPEPDMVQHAAKEAPIGLWTDIVSQVRRELNPSLASFFATTQNAPVQGVLRDNEFVLLCSNQFIVDMMNKPEVLELVARKVSAALGRPIRVKAMDKTAKQTSSQQMEQLLAFGRANPERININE